MCPIQSPLTHAPHCQQASISTSHFPEGGTWWLGLSYTSSFCQSLNLSNTLFYVLCFSHDHRRPPQWECSLSQLFQEATLRTCPIYPILATHSLEEKAGPELELDFLSYISLFSMIFLLVPIIIIIVYCCRAERCLKAQMLSPPWTTCTSCASARGPGTNSLAVHVGETASGPIWFTACRC